MDVRFIRILSLATFKTRRWFALVSVACLTSIAATPLSAEPQGDKRIKSIRTVTIPGEPGPSKVSRANLINDTFYIAGTSWTKAAGASLWLWRVDRSGKTLWEKRVPVEAAQSLEVLAVLPLVPSNTRPGESVGVKLVAARNSQPWAIAVTPEGEFQDELTFDPLDGVTGAMALAKDEMLLFGTGPRPKDDQPGVWVAHCSATGTLVWKQVYPLGTAADQVREAPRGTYRNAFLMAATILDDKTIALVGQAGAYSKFGTGPSNVYLLRIQPTGEQLGQAVIPQALLFFSSPDVIARCDQGLLVTYTSTSKFRPNDEAGLPDLEPRLARYDLNLKPVWEKPLPGLAIFVSPTIKGPRPYISVVPEMRKKGLLIRGLRDDGEEVFLAEVTDLDGIVRPVQTLRDRTATTILCNYTPTGAAAGKPLSARALLIDVDTNPTVSSR